MVYLWNYCRDGTPTMSYLSIVELHITVNNLTIVAREQRIKDEFMLPEPIKRTDSSSKMPDILRKIEFYRQIFMKIPNIKLQGTLPSRSRADTLRQTGGPGYVSRCYSRLSERP